MIINEDYIWITMATLLGLPDADKKDYIFYCTLASSELSEKLIKEPNESLTIASSAFLAIYYYCLLNSVADVGEVEFEAGDVHVRCNPKESGVEELKKTAYELVKPYLCTDNDFFFGAV